MTSIVDKTGETIAYLYQNIILDTRQEKVLGLILGNCLFGKKMPQLENILMIHSEKKMEKLLPN